MIFAAGSLIAVTPSHSFENCSKEETRKFCPIFVPSEAFSEFVTKAIVGNY
jgi:hypothetical protein